jgi:hypothetical protein
MINATSGFRHWTPILAKSEISESTGCTTQLMIRLLSPGS